jgi:hypothetical protein
MGVTPLKFRDAVADHISTMRDWRGHRLTGTLQ